MAQAGEEGTCWGLEVSSPPSLLAQHLTALHSSTCPDSKRAIFWFVFFFSPRVEKHPRGEMWAIWQGSWEHALPSTFGKTNSKTPGETSFSHQGNPLDPLPPTQGPSSQPLNLPGDEGSRRRGHITVDNGTGKGILHSCARFYPLEIQSCPVGKRQGCLENLRASRVKGRAAFRPVY